MDLREILPDQKRHPWELSRTDMMKRVVKGIVTIAAPSIADIGAGDMYFDEQLLKSIRDAKITAIDSGFDGKVKSKGIATLDDLKKLRDASQDIIIMMDVLEHVPDDSTFLKAAAKKLKVGGGIVITAPAFNCLWTPKDDFVKHFRRYTSRTLKSAIRSAGLKTEKSQYFYSSLVLPRILEKILKKDNSNEVGTWASTEKSLATRLVRFILNTDFMANLALSKIGLSLFGLSVLAVAKKE
jgi:ubiquinone/menaquinone biosynthesis C-methylase UbiE